MGFPRSHTTCRVWFSVLNAQESLAKAFDGQKKKKIKSGVGGNVERKLIVAKKAETTKSLFHIQ